MAQASLPKVSIGLPVRNGERYLEEALESLATQDYPNLEIIVSDNGSTDRTKEILADFLSRFPSIRVITQTETLAATDNFTFVLEEATGDYFCWAADDDVRAPGSVGRLAATLTCHPELVCVMSDVVNLFEETNRRTIDRLEGIRLEKVLADWPAVRRLFFAVPTSNIFFCVYGLYRTEALRRVRMKLNLGFSANTEIPMLAQVALLGGIASIAEEDFLYRRHEQSIYHLETAAEDESAPVRRRNIVRKAVMGIVLRSSLGWGEKKAILGDLWRSRQADARAERERLERKAKRGKRVETKKRKPAPGRFGRLKNRIRRRLFGHGRPELKPVQVASAPADGGSVGDPSDEKLVRGKANLEKPSLGYLLKREKARRRLEESGWSFEQPKRIKLLAEHGIASVIDCGANCGQFVERLRESGWSGQVASFEPMSREFAILKEKAAAAGDWRAFPYALGEASGQSTIRVAGNSFSSSLLNFSREFQELRPDASPVREETIQVRRLDEAVRDEGLVFDGPILLKLDVQGFEMNVLRGAGDFLDRVTLVQTELALIPSYENGATFAEVRDFLMKRGFVLVHLIDGHSDPATGELREVDGIFVNTRLLPKQA